MADRKHQHFIPKLYLKFFSFENDSHTIGLFHIDNDLYKVRVPLKPQAKEDYFYGEDGYLEEQLSKLENIAAPHLRKIIETGRLPPRSNPAYYRVFVFTVILAGRTKNTVEQMKEITDKLWWEVMRNDERFKDKIDNYRIYPKNLGALAVIATAERLPLAFDLRAKLLINKTHVNFITSDNPVIKYNQFLEQRKHPGGNVGLATKGLQIFFPLSSTLMLHLYDDWVYKVGGKTREIVELNNAGDIDKLNSLQVLNCHDHLYFNHSVTEHYIVSLVNSTKRKRIEEHSSLQRVKSYFDDEGQEHISYHTHGHNIEINLELSFITQTKKAKRHILDDYVVQLRNEQLRGKFRSESSTF